MYNRYIPPDAVYAPLPQEDGADLSGPVRPPSPPPIVRGEPPGGPPNKPTGALQQATQLLGGLFQHFSLENLDTGDILLILIVLFLFLEKEDNLDLVIALGLMLLLSLGEKPDPPAPDAAPSRPEG